MKWYLIVILSCIFLVTDDVQHPFMCLFDIHMFSLVKSLFKSFAHFLFVLFIYLFMAALGLCCCTWAFSSCREQGLLLVALRRLLIAVASLVAEHGLQARGLQQLWHTGLVALWHVGSSWTKDRTRVPCIGRQILFFFFFLFIYVGSSQTRAQTHVPCISRRILNHCATREAPAGEFLTTVPPGKFPHFLKIWFFMSYSFFLKFYLFIYLFMDVLGLCCWVWGFSSCSGQGILFVAVRRLLTVVASLVVDHRLQACGLQQLWHLGSVVVARGLQSTVSVVVVYGLSSCGARAQLLSSMWDLPGPGLEPVFPALAGGFLTTAPRGKPSCLILKFGESLHILDTNPLIYMLQIFFVSLCHVFSFSQFVFPRAKDFMLVKFSFSTFSFLFYALCFKK